MSGHPHRANRVRRLVARTLVFLPRLCSSAFLDVVPAASSRIRREISRQRSRLVPWLRPSQSQPCACPCQNLVWTSGPQGPNSRGGRRGGPMWTRRSPIKWWTRTICWRLRASRVRTLFRIWEIRLIPRENPKFVAQSFELPPCIEAGASRYHGWPGASPGLCVFQPSNVKLSCPVRLTVTSS